MSRALDYIRAHPGCSITDLRDAIDGDNADAVEMWLALERRGLITSEQVEGFGWKLTATGGTR